VYCGAIECRRARRRLYMRRYMRLWKLRHPDYWKNERQYSYLRRWRKTHPTYFRDWRRRRPRT
jgi:hypothetical protein